MKDFYILHGRNKSTLIVDLASLKDIYDSLEFYFACSFKQKISKAAACAYLAGLWIFKKSGLVSFKNTAYVQEYLQEITHSDVVFEVEPPCSILVSPTRDKVIIHYHRSHYQKFLFGKSQKKALAEIQAYQSIQDKPCRYLLISKLSYASEKRNYSVFELRNNFDSRIVAKPDASLLLAASIELFKLTKSGRILFSDLVSNLKRELLRQTSPEAIRLIDELDEAVQISKCEWLPEGFEHGDFKIWNIRCYERALHVFDFEESSLKGLPLMDLLNFYVDPMVLHEKSDQEIFGCFFDKSRQADFKVYLNEVGADIDCKSLFFIYLLRRGLFYQQGKVSGRFFCLARKYFVQFLKQG